MNGADQWYYMDGAQTRGPVPGAQIAQLIQNGALSPGAQVAQVGAQTWSPASVALAHLLGPQQPAFGPTYGQPGYGQAYAPTPAPPAPSTFAVRIHCIAGPDHDKAYMIGA